MLKKGEVKMIQKMIKEGLSKSAIARKLGLSRDTVSKYAKLPEGHIPAIKREATSTTVVMSPALLVIDEIGYFPMSK